jgi:hypothetical protein
MANAYKIHPKDAMKISEQIIKPIYTDRFNVVRQIFPIIQDLAEEDLQVRYYTEEDDIPYGVGQEVKHWLGHVGYNKTTKDTAVITANLHYGYDELQRIQNSSIPVDERMAAVRQKIIEAEQRVGIYGITVALDAIKAQTSFVSGVGTTSTAITTQLDSGTFATGISSFEAAMGQLIDGLGELVDPIAYLVTPDMYKQIRGAASGVTGELLLDELNRRMKAINPASPGVLMSKYMGATVTWNGNRNTITAGTLKGAIFNINPQYYRIHTSPMFIRTDGVSNLSGQHYMIGERFTPVYINKAAILYEATAT